MLTLAGFAEPGFVVCSTCADRIPSSPRQQIAVMAKLFESIGKLGLALAVGGGIANSALFNGGCDAVTPSLRL